MSMTGRYNLSQHHLGLVLVTGSAVAYSTAGFFTRLIPLDVWSLLFWRGLFAGVFMLLLLFLRRAHNGQPIRLMGKSGWVIAGWSTLGMICFLNALRAAPVADVALIYATVPFVTAILAWLVVREKSAWRTIGASILALAGVVIMVSDGWSAGHWRGDLLAFGMTCAMAALTVCFRRYREIDTLQVAAASCFLGSLVALPFATIGNVSANQIGLLVLFGIAQMGLGFLLLAAGTRRVSAMESALVGALDAPLAPLWVWLAFGETVSQATLVGGAIILLAVGADIALANRSAANMTAVTG
ncbi:MAG TPA: DMT family transporter [Terriglobales bacterium]|nr:DMT family transporter [Terriglobales bacterium]